MSERKPLNVLKVTDLEKSYGVDEQRSVGLKGITFSIRHGELVAVCGPSGSGKSTLLSLIGLVDRPSSGTVEIRGSVVDYDDERQLLILRRRDIGYIFQRFNLLPTFTVEENVAFPLTLLGTRLVDALEKANILLKTLGLGAKTRSLPRALSGGEMQRVAVARASIHSPAIILADEPTGSLDSKNGSLVLDLLAHLVQTGSTVLMATHSEAASRVASRVVSLLDGAIVSTSDSTW